MGLRCFLYPSWLVFESLTSEQKKYIESIFTFQIPDFVKIKMIRLNRLRKQMEMTNNVYDLAKIKSKISRLNKYDGKISFFNKRKSAIPIGLSHYISNYITVVKDYRNNNILLTPDDVKLSKHIKIRPYQAKAIRKIIQNKENGIINLAVNAGKTVIFVLSSAFLRKNNVCIITHRKEIFNTIISKFKEYLGYDDIGQLTSDTTYLSDEITIAMVQTLKNRLLFDKDVKRWFQKVNVIFIDEAHHVKSATYKKILRQARARLRVGFTGTMPDEGTIEYLEIEQFLGPVMLKVESFELIRQDISVLPEINIISCESMRVSSYSESINLNVIFNIDKNAKICQIVKDNKEEKIVVITDYIQHGRIISNALTRLGINNQFLYGEILNRKEILEKFSKEKRLNVLIATNILDEGVDIPSIGILILAFPRKSYRQIIQRIGRGMRINKNKYTLRVFDFKDENDKYLFDHMSKRIGYYEDENFVYTFSEITPSDIVRRIVSEEIKNELNSKIIQEGTEVS